MMWWHDGPGWGAWLVMSLGMLAFWSVVVFAIVVAVRGWTRHSEEQARAEDALQVLDHRFARGDIDAEEYRARRELLRSGR